MNVLLTLLILSAAGAAPSDSPYPDAVELFRCRFNGPLDADYDGWPDHWTRKVGPAFPHYVEIKLADEPSPVGKRSLRIALDGSGGVAFSPPIEIGGAYDYAAGGLLRTEKLQYDQAFLSVTFLDANQRPLGTFYSTRLGKEAAKWSRASIGPVAGPAPARFAVIGLHLEPTTKADLRGSAFFDDLWLARLPRVVFESNSPHNIYTDPAVIQLACRVTGFPKANPRAAFTLEDAFGRVLLKVEQRLNEPQPTGKSTKAGGQAPSGATPAKGEFTGSTVWRPVVKEPGFYRARVVLEGEQAGQARELSFVVVPARPVADSGEFGWSLPRDEPPLGAEALAEVLGQAGINWVKLSVWYGENQTARIARTVAMVERLSDRNIETVAVLADPPEELRRTLGRIGSLMAAEVFSADPKLWKKSLAPVIGPLGTRVQWWQLGDDRDASFVGYPGLAEKLGGVKKDLDQLGADVQLGFGWNWLEAIPSPQKAPWRFLTLVDGPTSTREQMAAHFAAAKSDGVARWVVIEPLPRGRYATERRAADLVQRMLAAKASGAKAIFAADPFNTEHGLVNDDGTPGELFLPWRTAALALAGAEYQGTLELARRSSALVFVRGEDVVVALWNDKPVDEAVFLGENARQFDLWGKAVRTATTARGPAFRAERLPTFIAGASEPIVRWSMAVALSPARLPSVSGQPHPASIRIRNTLGRAITGQATVAAPKGWRVDPPQFEFKLASGGETSQPVEFTLPFDATSGPQDVRLDFEVAAKSPCRFSVDRRLEVGMGDIAIDIRSHLDAKGNLEIEQRFVNQTDQPVSFRCGVLAPGRRRMETQVLKLGRGQDTKTYRFENGRELVGQTLRLRAEEVDGPRILNYRFVAER
ncbi:MAG: hypothetical protein ACYC35_20120 [Pirellulales bacterium]